MKTLTNEDCKYYLTSGPLSQPFIEDSIVKEKIMIDYNSKLQQGKQTSHIESLYNWLHRIVKHANDNKFIKENHFQRTAKEIWDSKLSTGCTDYALLFCTFARQIGIPSTLLHTAEYNWLERLKSDQDSKKHYGHSFCECFYNGKWILVDPTCKEIIYNYSSTKIELDYSVGGNNIFIPYYRGRDLHEKQTEKQHNNLMDEECLKLRI